MRFKRVYIEITNKCNLSCSFCPKLKRAPREMTSDEFAPVASQVRKFTDYIFLHVKGEPLSHSEFDKILTICDEEELKVNITTNGTLLKKSINTLQSHNCIRQVNISLHSMETVQKAESYINDIIEAAEILAAKTMVSLRIWTYDKGSNAVNNRMIEILEKHFNTEIPLNDKRSVLADNIFFSLGETFSWPSPLTPEISENGYCLGTRSHIAVLSDGTVVPCCLDAEGEINLGNAFTETIESILESERFRNMYNGFSKRKLSEILCKKCTYRQRFD